MTPPQLPSSVEEFFNELPGFSMCMTAGGPHTGASGGLTGAMDLANPASVPRTKAAPTSFRGLHIDILRLRPFGLFTLSISGGQRCVILHWEICGR
jgi:hypothetical protein